MSTTNMFYDNIRTYYKEVDMPGGWSFDHVERLKTIELMYNSQFKKGKYIKKFRKFFYNIVKPTCDIATKFIDLDTKDITLVPSRSGDEEVVWAMSRRLKQWLKDTHFGTLLNEIAFDLPKYGHAIIKKSNKGWKRVSILNIRTNPSVPWMKDSGFVYEPQYMSKEMLEEMKLDTSELFSREKGPEYLVYECYEKLGKKWRRTFKGGVWQNKNGNLEPPESKINHENEMLPPITLGIEIVDKLPYRELKWENVPGRWLGFGFVEYLEDNQIAINEAENLERKALMFKALNLWQSKDDSLKGSNVLTDAENGDILTVDSEIQPVAKDNSDLSAYNNTRSNWTGNTERKTHTSDITTGANLPSRTPLGVANLQASLATSYFEFKQENFGLFVQKLVAEDILPDFKRENSKEHILTFLSTDDDIDKLHGMIKKSMLANATQLFAERTGFFPSESQKAELSDRILSQLNEDKEKFLKIPDKTYENARYIVDVLVTGEQMDVAAQSQALQIALQTIGSNPAILQNKTTRTVFFRMLTIAGLSPLDLNMLEEIDQTPVPQGGSIAAPQGAPQPV